MKLGRKRKSSLDTAVELNITAFMNLMVILVPFLLITAVFSRMTVLELNLPPLGANNDDPNEPEPAKLELQILLTPDQFVVQDVNFGVIKVISRVTNGGAITDPDRFVWKPLRETLIELKSRFPEVVNVALLMDRAVEYKTMIAMMDQVRTADTVQSGTLETVELFPVISIGELAPAAPPEPAEPNAIQPGAAQ